MQGEKMDILKYHTIAEYESQKKECNILAAIYVHVQDQLRNQVKTRAICKKFRHGRCYKLNNNSNNLLFEFFGTQHFRVFLEPSYHGSKTLLKRVFGTPSKFIADFAVIRNPGACVPDPTFH